MQNNKNILWLIIAAIIIGFITGWFLKPAGSRTAYQTIKIHDTLKTSTTTYKILPGVNYNIDSLTTAINQFWKDSLKTLYGKGLFESHFSKSDDLGTRSYTLASRIPLDPESQLIIDESFTFPKRTFGLVGSLGSSASLGLKYYVLDSKNLSLSGFVLEGYVFNDKCWKPNIGIECEYKF
jgi:hypothetical protein